MGCAAILTTHLIEISQLFHPAWLQTWRSYKIVDLVIGYGFLWSDIAAYTLGISLGAGIDAFISGGKRPETNRDSG